jgi:hypothetical protein
MVSRSLRRSDPLISSTFARERHFKVKTKTSMSAFLSWLRRHPILAILLLLLSAVLGYVGYLFQPHGYRNLERLETLANRCTPPSASVAYVQECFREGGLQLTTESVANDEENPIVSGRQNLYAHKGDTVLAGTTNSGANGPIPCGRADLQIVLVFGPDQKLRDHMVKRFYTCP